MHNYHDQFYERGHWLLKVRQSLVVLLVWSLLAIPIIITGLTYWAYITDGRHGHYFWHYAEGFQELNFLMIFLLFALGITIVFCLTMAYVQTQRSNGLVDKWPLFDTSEEQADLEMAETFMDGRFGPAESRHNVDKYTVKAAQNLAKDELNQAIHQSKGGE